MWSFVLCLHCRNVSPVKGWADNSGKALPAFYKPPVCNFFYWKISVKLSHISNTQLFIFFLPVVRILKSFLILFKYILLIAVITMYKNNNYFFKMKHWPLYPWLAFPFPIPQSLLIAFLLFIDLYEINFLVSYLREII